MIYILVTIICTTPECLKKFNCILEYASIVIIKSTLNFEIRGLYELNEFYLSEIFYRTGKRIKNKGKLIIQTNCFDSISKVNYLLFTIKHFNYYPSVIFLIIIN